MSQLAIDIVLLPPSDIMDQAIAINKQFPNDPIQLNKTDCLPHISLCMGVAQEEDLGKIEEIVNEIIKEFSPLSLFIENIDGKHKRLSIYKGNEIKKLQENIMIKTSPYLSYNATEEMFYSPPTIEEKTLIWTNNFRENNGIGKFRPHIQLATASVMEDKELSINFTASQIALCHLGNYCTCRKVLYTRDLK